ncbi:DUF922 domain-containing protein [Hoeflea sp. YIM 152468]|uniref:DUF922 domain-containing protein n=1 Tax=Hoeflea sp. YIM 152468 TaxID=3031759 RepID=UPI0023DAE0E2|nr:DUF922 domain-containing protein [Hoeflea sp. YIM 152468]MDF1607214.1 DUF922 domain-containing protein [Hoeflea sp. YIM 152468]
MAVTFNPLAAAFIAATALTRLPGCRAGKFPATAICCLVVALSGCTTGKPGTTHRPYSVYADTTVGFARSVRSNAPRGGRAYGLVEITFHPDYKLVPGERGCSTQVKDVGLELVVILPQWRDGKPVPGPVKPRWRRFYQTVNAHEDSHIRIARDYALRMRQALARMRSKTSCSDLQGQINKRVVQIKAQHLRAHGRFDARDMKRLKSLI